ncbi:MAG: hypothetical protein FWH18_11940 [Marinilabiliaceae bacterium]|nr:hypothetical protein [Marinilabiliaceae bacterium]
MTHLNNVSANQRVCQKASANLPVCNIVLKKLRKAATLFLTALLFSFTQHAAAQEFFQFEVTMSAGATFSIPLSGYLNGVWNKPYNWNINWGDGTQQTIANTNSGAPQNSTSSIGIPHTYSAVGVYTITITPNASTDAWFAAFGFYNGTDGANIQSNKDMLTKVLSPITPLMTRTQAQLNAGTAPTSYEWAYTFWGCRYITMGQFFNFNNDWNNITTIGNYFAYYMFRDCSGTSFTMNEIFNLPSGIINVGANFASNMFNNCSGTSFTMNEIFNLPSGISTVGNEFAYYMFRDCSGSSFTMNEIFNVPSGITAVGNFFASSMFFDCSGSSFTMNEVFNLPSGITTVGDNFASGIFSGCSGTSFTMNEIFNLPSGITSAGDNFARSMFWLCSGTSFSMNEIFNLPSGITAVGNYFAYYMFNNCSGSSFTMNEIFNLPSGITTVGYYFAGLMFYQCYGSSFTMNEIFNLPSGITSAGDNFARSMFFLCNGSSFTMNEIFNLPSGITTVGDIFAGEMFYGCSGAAFKVNNIFKFPLLSQTELDKTDVFYRTFYNLGNASAQTRSATSIINGNSFPATNRQTFSSSAYFLDLNYIHFNWGGGGQTPVPPAITTPSQLPNGTFGNVYNLSLSASGTLPNLITWSFTAHGINNFPPGLTLSANGEISGVPTAIGNYNFSVTAENIFGIDTKVFYITIDAMPITITAAEGQSKIYGDADPILEYKFNPPLLGFDTFSGDLSRDRGENVNKYAITLGTLTAGGNYNITFISAIFEITQKPITIRATANQSKVYGEVDPVFSYTFSPALIGSDRFSGALSRVAGNNVGFYAITLGTLSAGNNYNLNLISSNFQITAIPISVTATPNQTKVYGETDPVFAYSFTPSLIGADDFSGTLSRDSGEDVGIYLINQGTLTAGSNYTLTYLSDDFEITQKPIIVSANPNQSKVYGESDPIFEYTFVPDLIGTDEFSGALSRDSGEDVGIYLINQGTLTAGSNYDITYLSDDFEITQKPIIVSANPNQSKVYGESDPIFEFTVVPDLIGTDELSGVLSRDAGEDVGIYLINQGTLTAGSNYDITYLSDDFEITPKPIIVSANPNQNKVYGENDPIFEFTVVPDLIGTDEFSGALSRDSGEDVGIYLINQGTLTASSNYNLTYLSDDFEITQKPIIVSANPNQIKVYGESDPIFEFTVVPDLIGTDEFSGALSRDSGEDVGIYLINQGTLTAGSNYDITYLSDDFEITQASGAIVETPIIEQIGTTILAIYPVSPPENGQTVEYSISLTSDVSENNWQIETLFEGLTDNTTYYIFARSAENQNYSAGVPSLPLEVKTDKVGIEVPNLTKLQVYPNPTSGQFSVFSYQFSDVGANNIHTIEILDITGSIVHREPCTVNRVPSPVNRVPSPVNRVPSTVNPATVEIDITHLPTGVYFVKVGNEMVKIVKR